MRREGLTLRLSTTGPVKDSTGQMGIHFTGEQWLDLIEDMKREFEKSEQLRKQMDDIKKKARADL